MSKKLKINDDGTFMANGVKYQSYNWLPIDYLMWYQYFAFHVDQGYNLGTLIDKWTEAFKQYDIDGKRATYDAKVYNLMKGIKTVYGEGEDPVLYMATLIYCKAGDKRTLWDKQVANSYINDWKMEGFDSESFFPQASKELNSLSKDLSASLENTLTEEAVKEMDQKMSN